MISPQKGPVDGWLIVRTLYSSAKKTNTILLLSVFELKAEYIGPTNRRRNAYKIKSYIINVEKGQKRNAAECRRLK